MNISEKEFKRLVDIGMDINILEKDRPFIMYLFEKEYYQTLIYVLKLKPNVNINYKGVTFLQHILYTKSDNENFLKEIMKTSDKQNDIITNLNDIITNLNLL